MRTLAIILGDQLREGYTADMGLDPAQDVVLMMEVAEESTHVPSHAQRTVMFLSAMRHFASRLTDAGWRVDYVALDDASNTGSFGGEIARAIRRHRPREVAFVRPGEWRVLRTIEGACETAGVTRRMVEDAHFLCTPAEFSAWAEGRKELILEYFYRDQRRRLGVLMADDGKPVGGAWNFDKDNRKAFRSKPRPPAPPRHEPDAVTREVIETVRRVLPGLPGEVAGFAWPVTREAALEDLRAFVAQRLARFGDYQDAMWTGLSTLYHAVISPAMNLKLLDPREVVEAALRADRAPLNAVEGFVRQVIGWREFVRGVYWTRGEGYGLMNALDQHGSLPDFYWTGRTDMRCMAESLRSVTESAYAHHISRLMVTGNFALIAGVQPREVSDWYLGMYADGVDWVTLPNTLGMAMHADGGVVGTKPYAASGKYIDRMSNYCEHCRYDVGRRSGEGACPFNVFYWDFLLRNRSRLSANRRMAMVLKNVDRLTPAERQEITVSARSLRRSMGVGSDGESSAGLDA